MLRKRVLAIMSAMVLVGGAGLAFAPSAEAQWYVSANAGSAIIIDADFTDRFTTSGASPTSGSIIGKIEFEKGFALSGAVGHAWGGFRVEAEFSYRKTDLDSADIETLTIAGALFTALGKVNLAGFTSVFGVMGNGWYDIDTGTPWVPFFGAGLGVARTKLDIESVAGIAVDFDESEMVLAYQIAAGVGYKVTPNVTLNLTYRFFATSDLEFDDGVDKIDAEYRSHNVMVGVVASF